MSCTRPITAQSYDCPTTGLKAIRFRNFEGEPNLQLPCNKCDSCKLFKAREWALRCWHESQMHEENAYVTFTYADANLPPYEELRHRDFQLFLKRLRAKYPDRKFSYFMCGEYGDDTHRPHYHAILFGYFPPDPKYHRTENGHRYYKSEELDSLWQQGFTDTSYVSYHNAGYVARYTLKKQLPKEALQDRYIYIDVNGDTQTRTFEYVRMSTGRRDSSEADYGHGIGGAWLRKYWQRVLEQDSVLDPNGYELPVPRYYRQILRDYICEETSELNAQRRIEKAQADPDNQPDRLRQKEICVKARLKQLPRPYL